MIKKSNLPSPFCPEGDPVLSYQVLMCFVYYLIQNESTHAMNTGKDKFYNIHKFKNLTEHLKKERTNLQCIFNMLPFIYLENYFSRQIFLPPLF